VHTEIRSEPWNYFPGPPLKDDVPRNIPPERPPHIVGPGDREHAPTAEALGPRDGAGGPNPKAYGPIAGAGGFDRVGE
jgi:hypothetical protein